MEGDVCTVTGPAAAEAIAAEVVGRGWKLRLLAPARDDLEAAFLAAVTGTAVHLVMTGTLRIARRELRAYLVAPWAYGVAATFLVLTGTIFFVVADGSREASLRFWFPNLAFVLIVTAPIVTSRLVAEEWRSRHLDILLARPISPAALVVGKWLAAVGFFVLLLAATLDLPGVPGPLRANPTGRRSSPPTSVRSCSSACSSPSAP